MSIVMRLLVSLLVMTNLATSQASKREAPIIDKLWGCHNFYCSPDSFSLSVRNFDRSIKNPQVRLTTSHPLSHPPENRVSLMANCEQTDPDWLGASVHCYYPIDTPAKVRLDVSISFDGEVWSMGPPCDPRVFLENAPRQPQTPNITAVHDYCGSLGCSDGSNVFIYGTSLLDNHFNAAVAISPDFNNPDYEPVDCPFDAFWARVNHVEFSLPSVPDSFRGVNVQFRLSHLWGTTVFNSSLKYRPPSSSSTGGWRSSSSSVNPAIYVPSIVVFVVMIFLAVLFAVRRRASCSYISSDESAIPQAVYTSVYAPQQPRVPLLSIQYQPAQHMQYPSNEYHPSVASAYPHVHVYQDYNEQQ